MKRRLACCAAAALAAGHTTPASALRGAPRSGRGRDDRTARKLAREDGRKNRPAVPDARRAERIRHLAGLELDGLQARRSAEADRDSEGAAPESRRRRRRELYLSAMHKKTSTYGAVSVVGGNDAVNFQTRPPTGRPTAMPSRVPTDRPAEAADEEIVANSAGTDATDGGGTAGGGRPVYYPLYTDGRNAGRCASDGNEPASYYERSRSPYFLFVTLGDCCDEWYADSDGCRDGFAFPVDGVLLRRDPVTGHVIHRADAGTAEEEEEMLAHSAGTGSFERIDVWEASEEDILAKARAESSEAIHAKVKADSSASKFAQSSSGSAVVTGSNHYYYPSFDTSAYPSGACLDDGNEPADFARDPRTYLFDSPRDCCAEWFVDVESCMSATIVGHSAPVPGPKAIPPDDDHPTPYPTTWTTPYPTYGDDPEVGDDGAASPPADGPVRNSGHGSVLPSSSPRPDLSFEESFETGDFALHPWEVVTSPSGVDGWEADMSAVAYDGSYAARAGVLDVPGSASTLGIDLRTRDVTGGGLLTFAVKANVEMPVDRLTFRIGDYPIRTFDRVRPDGEWDEVSVLLLRGEHRLSWTYEYLGVPGLDVPSLPGYAMDGRRAEPTWLDGIKLAPFTGDVVLEDNGAPWGVLSSPTAAIWSLAPDPEAFSGSNSYAAYTSDVLASTGSADMAMTVIVGPDGGVLSYASRASVYAPHDVLEVSVNGVPTVAVTSPTDGWETEFVELHPGRNRVVWRLVKNAPGLESGLLRNVAKPEGHGGWARVDSITYLDRSNQMMMTTSTTPAWTTSEEATTTSTTEFVTTTDEPTTTTELTTTEATTTELTTTEATTTEATTTEAVIMFNSEAKPSSTSGGCPAGLSPVQGLPGCCVEEPDYLGDGACDPWSPYNTVECMYDLGDCCASTCDTTAAYGCDTSEGDVGPDGSPIGPFGFFCLDPRHSTIDEGRCDVENREWIGDGGCDAEGGYNTAECGWDGGDCCEGTCGADLSFWTCGLNQPFVCLDPDPEGGSTNPTGSAVIEPSSSAYGLSETFEGNVLTPPQWRTGAGLGASWSIERDGPGGNRYAEARTADIVSDGAEAVLQLSLSSPSGGTLSYELLAEVGAPHEDFVVRVDGGVLDVVSSPMDGWEGREAVLPGGPHVVQWVLRKAPMGGAASDGEISSASARASGIVRVDNVAFVPI